MEFCRLYDHHFINQGRDSVEYARHHIIGLMGTQRSKNIEAIENDVAGSDYQGMEQFISSSPWDHRSLLDDVAKDANEAIGDEVETGFFLDETRYRFRCEIQWLACESGFDGVHQVEAVLTGGEEVTTDRAKHFGPALAAETS